MYIPLAIDNHRVSRSLANELIYRNPKPRPHRKQRQKRLLQLPKQPRRRRPKLLQNQKQQNLPHPRNERNQTLRTRTRTRLILLFTTTPCCQPHHQAPRSRRKLLRLRRQVENHWQSSKMRPSTLMGRATPNPRRAPGRPISTRRQASEPIPHLQCSH